MRCVTELGKTGRRCHVRCLSKPRSGPGEVGSFRIDLLVAVIFTISRFLNRFDLVIEIPQDGLHVFIGRFVHLGFLYLVLGPSSLCLCKVALNPNFFRTKFPVGADDLEWRIAAGSVRREGPLGSLFADCQVCFDSVPVEEERVVLVAPEVVPRVVVESVVRIVVRISIRVIVEVGVGIVAEVTV